MGKHLELTPRLRQIAAWVRQGARLADVGTDHAYLPVWLTLQGRVASAIASDLRRGPLDRAQETGRRYGVGDRITFRLGNGLAAVAPEECDTIVIAGMGGENIAQILAGAPWTADGRHTLLLQPQSRAEALRRFLAEHGYAIAREALVRDRGLSLSRDRGRGRGDASHAGPAVGRGGPALRPPGGPLHHREDHPAARRRRPGPTGRRRQRPGNGAITPGPSSRSFCK